MAKAPNTENYFVGRGEIYLARLDSDGNSLGELHLGNATDFNYTMENESLKHYESMGGISNRDLQLDTRTTVSCAFTLEEFSKENIALALRAQEPTTETQASGSNSESLTAYTGKYIDLAYRNVSNVSIDTYVEGTDFTVDFDTGRVLILESGDISDEESITVDYDYSSETWNVIKPNSNDETIEAFVRYVGNNMTGPNYELECWKVKVRVSEAVTMLQTADEFATLSFSGDMQADSTNHPDAPYFMVRQKGTTAGSS